MLLTDLKTGDRAIITKVAGYGAFRRRIMEMGFIKGQEVSVIMNAPLKDPIIYKVMDYEVSLRRSEAALIEVITEDEVIKKIEESESLELPAAEETIKRKIEAERKTITIALVGNPNCGKTSLFNRVSGSREHVGNYSGVTVDAKQGTFTYKGYKFIIYDLPGTYALSAYSPEEVYVREHIVTHSPDIILNVVAASNLERNLYLTTELINMDYSMVVALNMFDELLAQGSVLDYEKLGSMLGVPMVPTNSRNGEGYTKLYDTIIEVVEHRNETIRHIHINHGDILEKGITKLHKAIREKDLFTQQFSSRYLSIKLLERDKEVEALFNKATNAASILLLRDKIVSKIEDILDEDIESAVTNRNYGFISGALKESFQPSEKERVESARIVDAVVTHKLFGFPIFLFMMWVMFQSTFILGAYPMEWIEMGVEYIAKFMESVMSDGMLKDLIIDGVIGGVGGVIVFLPNIVILYLFISFMEDSGYMARAAFIMDKLMHKMGLHGKSFIPLLTGFGCNVPAIMATRTIESKSSRIITILINPFISCSARLPIYLLFVAAFFPSHSGTVLFLIYLLGITMAVLTAKILRKFYFHQDETPFVMELPPYRIPTAKSIVSHMWDKSYQYLRKMGGIILIASVAIWFMSYFPHNEGVSESQQQENSYLGRIGKLCEPVMEPLGFNWQANVSILTGMAAKEVVVSTLGVLYSDGDDSATSDERLPERLKAEDPETGKPRFTIISALAFMAFTLLCFPCLATIAAVIHEAGSWRWAAFIIGYNTTLAWVVAWIITQVGNMII